MGLRLIRESKPRGKPHEAVADEIPRDVQAGQPPLRGIDVVLIEIEPGEGSLFGVHLVRRDEELLAVG